MICFLILFNEPFYFFHALIPYKIVSIMNTVIQATFISLLLHFWSFLIDTISEEDVIRESPIKFYGPKLLLVVLIWLFLMVALALVRMQEAADPTFYWDLDINQTSVKALSWILFCLLIIYSLYLIGITMKACAAIRRLKESYKFVIGMTLIVIATCVFFLSFLGLQKYVSTTTSIFKLLSIEALLNLYIYVIAYLYSPCVMSSTSRVRAHKENEHRQIINQLYEQELPEMPTMRDDTEGYQDRNIGDYQVDSRRDSQGDGKRREFKVDPDQEKKNKIWEQIEKEAEDDEDEDKDSDDNDSGPEVANDTESSESDSEGDNDPEKGRESI